MWVEYLNPWVAKWLASECIVSTTPSALGHGSCHKNQTGIQEKDLK